MNTSPYTNFDLPKLHLSDTNHYIPPKTRNPERRAYLHEKPAGTMLAEQQAHGLAIASFILNSVTEPRDFAYVAPVIAMSALNTSWYGFARNAVTMRRVLPLPRYAVADDEVWRETTQGLLAKSKEQLERVIPLAHTVVRATVNRASSLERKQRIASREIGSFAIKLGTAGHIPYASTVYDAQIYARNRSLDLLEASRTYSAQLGVHPSIAQFSDPNSPLAVEWRRDAPQQAYESYEQALAEVPLAH